LKIKSPRRANQTITTLLERASCRNFLSRKIPARVLDLVLESGCHAPTSGNLQPYSIIKIENRKIRARLAELFDQDFIAQELMPLGNERYLRIFRDFGFGWFKKYHPGKGKK
jgi:nitroreductase